MSGRKRVGILISGRGSNMAALIDSARDPAYPAEIVCVGANLPDAGGLARAAEAGIPTFAVDHRLYKGQGRQAHDAAMTAALEAAGVEIVVLAGYMRLLSSWFVERWQDRLINIHPALLPSYKGLHTHERALADGVRLHGCTVHYARAEMDVGPIIAQAAVPVLDGDTPDSLAARVLGAEHRIYPMALRWVAEGRARVVAGPGDMEVVRIDGIADAPPMLVWPQG